MKKRIAFLLIACIMLGASFTAYAAPEPQQWQTAITFIDVKTGEKVSAMLTETPMVKVFSLCAHKNVDIHVGAVVSSTCEYETRQYSETCVDCGAKIIVGTIAIDLVTPN